VETTEITRAPRTDILREALKNPHAVTRELNNRSLYQFLQYFWPVVSAHTFSPNWHIELLCRELEQLAEGVGSKQPRLHDLIINVPPGSTKTVTCSIMFPAWCWTKWPWMRFITASYSKDLSLENADYCRDLIKSDLFQKLYPEIQIKEDKDTKSNFKIVQRIVGIGGKVKQLGGGGRYSTSVGATVTGFHGDILIVDDPLNPTQAASDIQLKIANDWMEQTLPTRKTNKDNTPTVLIMQRLHQDDPSGHLLAKMKENIRHICLPAEIRNYKKQLNPPELEKFYIDDLLDTKRISWKVLGDMEATMGTYGYAGQMGQDPTPPGGGMFKVDKISIINPNQMPSFKDIVHTVRYWDKAGTADGGAYTAGVKMSKLSGNMLPFCWLIEDVIRGRWASNERERIILQTAVADGQRVEIYVEQEGGSGGKESAEGTIRNLAGFVCRADHPTGDKVFRADPFSVQVNIGAVMMVRGDFNHNFLEELRFFPFSTNRDQVDATSGSFNHLVGKKMVRRIT
jgi:predicted phage terminase large subunit-like protein